MCSTLDSAGDTNLRAAARSASDVMTHANQDAEDGAVEQCLQPGGKASVGRSVCLGSSRLVSLNDTRGMSEGGTHPHICSRICTSAAVLRNDAAHGCGQRTAHDGEEELQEVLHKEERKRREERRSSGVLLVVVVVLYV